MSKDFSSFISKSLHKTPTMKVTVTNSKGSVVEVFDAPEGFQMERYVMSLYPDSGIILDFPNKSTFIVEVVVSQEDHTVQMKYTGKYSKPKAFAGPGLILNDVIKKEGQNEH